MVDVGEQGNVKVNAGLSDLMTKLTVASAPVLPLPSSSASSSSSSLERPAGGSTTGICVGGSRSCQRDVARA